MKGPGINPQPGKTYKRCSENYNVHIICIFSVITFSIYVYRGNIFHSEPFLESYIIILQNKPLSDLKTRPTVLHGASNLRRSTATSRTRSKSPGAGNVWVPPPGKASKSNKLLWQVRIILTLLLF